MREELDREGKIHHLCRVTITRREVGQASLGNQVDLPPMSRTPFLMAK